jgi:taurine transport system ATP-binding protein
MAGFLPLSSGSIALNGIEVTRPGADRGVVFQKDTLLPWKTVAENVALGLKFAGAGRTERLDRAHELLRLVGLQDFAAAAPYELSGGMRQRVGIARALATDPAILLMDEPFGALDSLTREQMQELLVDVWDRTGKRIFFITHSIEEALFLGTHLVVMSPRPGRIVARYDLDFVKTFAATRDARAVKGAPAFGALRDDIRDIVHETQVLRSAAQ